MNESRDNFVPMARRFRGYLPVVVDVETGGFNSHTDALLEVAAVIIATDDKGFLQREKTLSTQIQPFEGANMDPASLQVNGIDPHHPLRIALPEAEALEYVFKAVRKAVKDNECSRAILVGHNAAFDLAFINAAATRCGIKRSPFHPFSTFDTVSLAALAYGQTVLARAAQAARISWDEKEAHSAGYDAEKTAELFCTVCNRWRMMESAWDMEGSTLLTGSNNF